MLRSKPEPPSLDSYDDTGVGSLIFPQIAHTIFFKLYADWVCFWHLEQNFCGGAEELSLSCNSPRIPLPLLALTSSSEELTELILA